MQFFPRAVRPISIAFSARDFALPVKGAAAFATGQAGCSGWKCPIDELKTPHSSAIAIEEALKKSSRKTALTLPQVGAAVKIQK
jgi:hypothetical protein